MKPAEVDVFEDFAREFIRRHSGRGPLHVVLDVLPEFHLRHVAAKRELARTIHGLRDHHLKARGVLRSGGPVAEILKTAEVERASLVVIGTHGRRGVAHVLMGSVAERVVRSAPCPVLTVGPGERLTKSRSMPRGDLMAKYGKKAQKRVESAMHRMKRGQLRSGRTGTKVESREQAIAIGLSEARRTGAKVPPRKKQARSGRSRNER
jgi:nucleotide-binding universal stress UspA family protein